MTNVSDNGPRRYTDLLTTSCFKTGADGRKIFYPWGMLGNGYIIPSSNDYERLNDLLKVYMIAALLFILPPAVNSSALATTILATLALVFYWVWMRLELPALQRTQEKLTYGVSIGNFARLAPAWLLWVEAILLLLLVAAGVATLFIQPGQWMIALGGILFFGAGAVMFAFMLVLRRRPVRGQS